jgi:hypothetical protein
MNPRRSMTTTEMSVQLQSQVITEIPDANEDDGADEEAAHCTANTEVESDDEDF